MTEAPFRKFSPLWNKYRPVILKMMLDAANAPQAYKLSEYEFKAMDSKKKGSFRFQLALTASKATNNIKDSEAAQDLLSMLQMSPKASELMKMHSYEMELDRNFTFHVLQSSAIVS